MQVELRARLPGQVCTSERTAMPDADVPGPRSANAPSPSSPRPARSRPPPLAVPHTRALRLPLSKSSDAYLSPKARPAHRAVIFPARRPQVKPGQRGLLPRTDWRDLSRLCVSISAYYRAQWLSIPTARTLHACRSTRPSSFSATSPAKAVSTSSKLSTQSSKKHALFILASQSSSRVQYCVLFSGVRTYPALPRPARSQPPYPHRGHGSHRPARRGRSRTLQRPLL